MIKHIYFACGDFRMLGYLLELQGRFNKFLCFLCLSDSRPGAEQYDRVKWHRNIF